MNLTPGLTVKRQAVCWCWSSLHLMLSFRDDSNSSGSCVAIFGLEHTQIIRDCSVEWLRKDKVRLRPCLGRDSLTILDQRGGHSNLLH